MLDTAQSEVVFSGPDGEPLIRKTPGVCGGEACIRDTRIMVWLLVSFMRQSMTEPQLLAAYPTLTSTDLTAARDYARLHPTEIDEAIRLNDSAESEWPRWPSSIRTRTFLCPLFWSYGKWAMMFCALRKRGKLANRFPTCAFWILPSPLGGP